MGFAPTRPRRTPVSETGAYTSSATRRKKLVRTRGFAPPRARAHELLRLVRILGSATSGCWSASRDLHPHALCRAAGFKPAVFPGFTRGRRNGQVAGNCTRFPGVTSRCPATWAAHLSVRSGRRRGSRIRTGIAAHEGLSFACLLLHQPPMRKVNGAHTTRAWRGLRNVDAEPQSSATASTSRTSASGSRSSFCMMSNTRSLQPARQKTRSCGNWSVP